QETQAARIASDLGGLEAKSRDAEAALAELLARQAAMRAERRVAEAALEAARAQVARTAAESAKLGEQLETLGSGDDLAATRDEANRRAANAATALQAAEQQRVAAEAGRATAAEQRDSAESALASARAALAAARSEHDALARAFEQAGTGTMIARLSAKPGYERALAAALGDVLEAAIGGDGARR